MKSNFYPIAFDFEEFDIQCVPYQDGLLSQLRQRHNVTHSFFRRGDFIYISPGTASAETLGITVRLRIKEYPEVVSSLIKHIFFRTVKNAQPTLQPEFYPFRFAARKMDLDLASQYVSEPLRGLLTYKRITEVQFRDHIDTNGQIMFGALINHQYQWNLDLNCDQLVEAGFDIMSREVTGTQVPEYVDGVVAPEISLLGRVQQVDNGKVKIDTSNGLLEYPLVNLHLRNSRENIEAFLA